VLEDATPTEREAVQLRWRALNPDSTSSGPSEVEAAALLKEIRDRAIAIENASLEMLKQQMKIQSKAQVAKQGRSLFFTVAAIIGLVILVVGTYYLMGR